MYLGERYGYQLLSPNGFNYITGGGGIVFSLSVVEKLVQSCTCPTPSSPDDMIIALCLQRIGIEPIHSSRFHQVKYLFFVTAIFLLNQFMVYFVHSFIRFAHFVRLVQLTIPRNCYCTTNRFRSISSGKSTRLKFMSVGSMGVAYNGRLKPANTMKVKTIIAFEIRMMC